MYRECWVSPDSALLLLVVVLALVLAGAIAAAGRNASAARKFRKLYQDEAADFRRWKRERGWAIAQPPVHSRPFDLES